MARSSRRHRLAAQFFILALAMFPPLTHPQPAWAQLSGFVGDLIGNPIPGALVSVQASDVYTTTDPDGRFELPEASGTSLVIVAARKGYYNGSLPVDAPASSLLLSLQQVPQADDSNYTLVEPARCGSCHPTQLSQWLGSPMARAGLNTWVHDIFNGTGTPGGMGGFVYTRDSTFAHSNPSSECASCHQPQTWIEHPLSPLEDPQTPTPGVLHGVSCDVCHKIADIDVSRINFPGIFPGAVTLTRPLGPAFNQVQYGVLGDSDYSEPSLMRSSFQPQLVAEVCGACHQDKNDPDEDGDFEEPEGVISEPTYIEWRESPYGDLDSPHYATCVDCHMPPAGVSEVCDELFPPLIRDPDSIRSHTIEGTTAYFLEHAAALSLQIGRAGDTLQASVSITNSGTGHHVPTGVTVRNMILLVEAWREEDSLALAFSGTQTVHELGGVGNPEQGYYAGRPGKFYAKVNHDATGSGPTFFTDATGIQFDNRIPALATDTTDYGFAIPEGDGTLRVRARLIYRRAFRFLVDAKQWIYDGHGRPLEDILPPHYGHLMAQVEGTIPAVSCQGKPAGASCSDENICNGEESCDGAGQCRPGTPLICDDGNACTDDACDPQSGCVHTSNMDPCDDDDTCTTDDVCTNGACLGKPPPECDDGNPCTDDSCDADLNCVNTASTRPCEDGDACTAGDVCSDETCIPGPPLDCSDGNGCTQDSCDAQTGCLHAATPATQCRVAGRAMFRINDREDVAHDRLKLRWWRGEPLIQADLGDPSSLANYALCVYDGLGGKPTLVSSLEIPPGSSWRDKSPKGWVYKDRSGAADGVWSIKLGTGVAGRSSVQVQARGLNLRMPPAAGPFRFFEQDPYVVVQLMNDETGVCWTSKFTPAQNKKNRHGEYGARVP